MKAKQDTSYRPMAITSMWQLIEAVADMETRVGLIYKRFAKMFSSHAAAAAFWRDLATEEEMHATFVGSTRDVFPASTPAPKGDWSTRLMRIDGLLRNIEADLDTGLPLVEAIARAEELERSELNVMTGMVLDSAEANSSGFSKVGKLWRVVDVHAEKMAQARAQFCGGEGS